MLNELLIKYSILAKNLEEDCQRYKNVIEVQRKQIIEAEADVIAVEKVLVEREEELEDYKIMYESAMDELDFKDAYIKELEEQVEDVEHIKEIERMTWEHWQKIKKDVLKDIK